MPSEKQSHLKPNQSQLSPNPILPVAALSVSPLPFVPDFFFLRFCVFAFAVCVRTYVASSHEIRGVVDKSAYGEETTRLD